MIPPASPASSPTGSLDVVDPGSDIGEGFMEVVKQCDGPILVSDREDSMEEIEIPGGSEKALVPTVSDSDESAEIVDVNGLTEDDDPGNQSSGGSDDSIPIIKKRKATTTQPSKDHTSVTDVGEPSTPRHPCGRSLAATRIKGRGFLFPPPPRPIRASAATQTSEPCAFRAFLANPPQYEENDPRRFWMEMGQRLFADSSAASPNIPTDSVESYEVMRSLDYDIGIPADQFLRLFDVCRRCGHVMTCYWAEDHDSVCPAAMHS